MVGAGVLLRRLARRFPLALAAPLAWVTGEAVRFGLDAPLSFGWWRLGTLSHAQVWFASGARVFGVWGLSVAMAAFAGWIADRLRGASAVGSVRLSYGVGLGVPLLVIAAGWFTSPPAMVDGPRVMVVTPGLEQKLKAHAEDYLQVRLIDPYQLLADGIEAARAAGEPSPDLVCLGETMLPGISIASDVWPALESGVNAPGFAGRIWSLDELQASQDMLQYAVDLALGRALPSQKLLSRYPQPWLRAAAQGTPPIPPGASLFGGVEAMVVRDGALWRMNAAQIWNPEGQPGPVASKVHLVPAAENPYPAAYLPWLLRIIQSVGGYIPDFVTNGVSAVLPFTGRDGRTWRAGVLICYDNSYDDPFLGVQGGQGVDFHLVASNEAWYEESVLMDHMLAFSRLEAIQVGRSVLRATNSGASALFGPDGRLLALLEQDGRHKMVRGTLRVTVPVPKRDADGAAPLTPYVRTRRIQAWAFGILVLACAFLAGKR